MSTRMFACAVFAMLNVLFLMLAAPISVERCEGEEIGKHGRI